MYTGMEKSKHTMVIAEIGVNHNGDLALCRTLIEKAVEAGVDAVKFQTFSADNLVTRSAPKAQYQLRNTSLEESQRAMLKRLELPREYHFDLKKFCDEKGVTFLSTAFDRESLDFLVELGLDTLKIPSGEITNGPLVLAFAQTRKSLLLSTGMATLGEIETALKVIAFGFTHPDAEVQEVSIADFEEAYFSERGQGLLKERVTLLHCSTEYPASYSGINLKVLRTLKESFGLKVGYSDHSVGVTVPIAATTLGAQVIEKHFTLDKNLPGPDHKASLEPAELKEMVDGIRVVEKILGDGRKIPNPEELPNRSVVRKSLVALKSVRMGEVFTRENITAKRPGTGLSPMLYWDMLGTHAKREYQEDEIIG